MRRAPLHITSTANPRLKELAALTQKKHRAQTGLFVAEGLQTLTYALENGWKPETLVFAEGEKHHLLEALEDAAKSTITVPNYLLEKMTKRENAQSVVATLKQRWHDLKQMKAENGDVWLALDRVRDPGNLGTIIRTCDAAGVAGVILIDDCTDPYATECVRATMGSIFHVPLFAASTEEFLDWRKGFDGPVYGTHLRGTVDFRGLGEGVKEPMLVLMGNEQQGLTEELARACSDRVKIPMLGKLESLNLATATAVMLYELRRSVF